MRKNVFIAGLAALTLATSAFATMSSAEAQQFRAGAYDSGYDHAHRSAVGSAAAHLSAHDYYGRPSNNYDWPYGRGVSH